MLWCALFIVPHSPNIALMNQNIINRLIYNDSHRLQIGSIKQRYMHNTNAQLCAPERTAGMYFLHNQSRLQPYWLFIILILINWFDLTKCWKKVKKKENITLNMLFYLTKIFWQNHDTIQKKSIWHFCLTINYSSINALVKKWFKTTHFKFLLHLTSICKCAENIFIMNAT